MRPAAAILARCSLAVWGVTVATRASSDAVNARPSISASNMPTRAGSPASAAISANLALFDMLFRGMSLRHSRSGCFGRHRNTFPLIGGTVSLLVDRALRRQQILENRMLDTNVIVVVASTFLLEGMGKGGIGLGLPRVTLGVITVAFDLPSAMSLLLVPSFVTNLWQASVGGHSKAILLRLWPFLFMATVTVWVGAQALTRVELSLLTALLGVLLATYSMVTLRGIQLTIPARHETWVGTLVGAANGVLTGMTGSSVVPGVMFLQAIGLPRDMLIKAMGMLFTAP